MFEKYLKDLENHCKKGFESLILRAYENKMRIQNDFFPTYERFTLKANQKPPVEFINQVLYRTSCSIDASSFIVQPLTDDYSLALLNGRVCVISIFG